MKLQSAIKEARALMMMAILVISVASIAPITNTATASTNTTWYAGATSTDPSAIPNYGVRSVIDVMNQSNIPSGSDLMPWLAVTLSNNIWIQAGYFNQPTGSGSIDPPTGFVEIWNLNTYSILQTIYPHVTTGHHTFSIYLQSGTTWAVSYDNTIWTTYDTGTSVSSSTQPVEALVEMQAPSMLSINTVDFPTAMEVEKIAGGPWTNVSTAISGYNGFGVQGQLQNSSLPPEYVNIGTSIPIAHGAMLWNISTSDTSINNSSPTILIISPTSNSWNRGNISVSASASTSGTDTISNIQLYVDNNLLGADTVSPYTFSLATTTLTNSQHTLKVVATDSNNNQVSNSINVNVDNTPPTITVPTSVTEEATSATGALVTYSVTATDSDGVLATGPTCAPSSGSEFALGTTTVTCTAQDAAGNIGSSSFNVSVIDTTAPTIYVPANFTVQATSQSGAVVSYVATATDLVDSSINPVCLPQSGSVFIIGTTIVTCTATDSHGNSAIAFFSVTVTAPAPPTVTITSPSSQSIVKGTITVSATAYSSIGISQVRLYVDGVLKSTMTVSPYSSSLNTKTLKNGSHTISAVAYDVLGNTGSGSIIVTVKNK